MPSIMTQPPATDPSHGRSKTADIYVRVLVIVSSLVRPVVHWQVWAPLATAQDSPLSIARGELQVKHTESPQLEVCLSCPEQLEV